MDLEVIAKLTEPHIGEKLFLWENVCKDCVCLKNLPEVINFELIEKVLQNDLMKHERGRILLEKGVPVDKIEEIWIEFHRIIRIDHLWMFKNLKKLKLDNNYIEKIENLESLIHLNELDLSFNYITKIENLESFAQLEILSLFSNMISVIENMENLKNLKIFSIGRNRISSLESVVYMRKLPNLRSLNMAENICSSTDNFRYYIAKFLPNVVYYEYKMITTIEKNIGDEIFQKEFEIMFKEEEEELGKKRQKEKEEEEAKLHMDCFVEFLNTRRLFESFFENDPEGTALLLIGDKVEEKHATYRESVLRISRNIFDVGQKYYKTRQEEKKYYTSSIETIIDRSQAEGVAHMESFLQGKAELFNNIKSLEKEFEDEKIENFDFLEEKIKEYNETYEKMLNSIWKVLMKLEIQLNDLMLETNEIYEHFLNDTINGFIEDSQELFSQMRNSLADYHDEIQIIAEDFFTQHQEDEEAKRKAIAELNYSGIMITEEENPAPNETKGEENPTSEEEEEGIEAVKDKITSKWKDIDIAKVNKVKWMQLLTLLIDTVPKTLKCYLKDRETLANCLASSKDLHLLLLDNREDLLISRARNWLADSVDTMINAEIVRNREKVMEISIFLQKQREEWESLPIIADAIFTNLLKPLVIGAA